MNTSDLLIGLLYVRAFYMLLSGGIKGGNFDQFNHILIVNLITCPNLFSNRLNHGVGLYLLMHVHFGYLHHAQISVDLLLKVVVELKVLCKLLPI